MIDLIKKSVMAGIGAAVVTKEKVEEALEDFVRQGKLSAADAAGMSSNSYAALAVGSLLAGASALKIAGRRARDRKAGIGVAI